MLLCSIRPIYLICLKAILWFDSAFSLLYDNALYSIQFFLLVNQIFVVSNGSLSLVHFFVFPLIYLLVLPCVFPVLICCSFDMTCIIWCSCSSCRTRFKYVEMTIEMSRCTGYIFIEMNRKFPSIYMYMCPLCQWLELCMLNLQSAPFHHWNGSKQEEFDDYWSS